MADTYDGFGIYVHWPFCMAKCPYCDFNSHVREEVDHSAWRSALRTDLQTQAQKTEMRKVSSVFFGGGTPSLMQPETVGAVLDDIAKHWGLADDFEVSLEANPTSVEADKFAGFRSAGVTRVSMGIQALNDPDLKALGRMHSAQEAMAAFDIARAHFDRISFDLIYARQNQTLANWEAELKRALDMAVDHLSLYQLTIEAGTRFGDLYDRGKLRGLPSDDLGAEMYEMTQEICEEAGLPAYEVSNHARKDAQCRHNLTYWRYEPYLGIGPGAHGRGLRDGQSVEMISRSNPEGWLQAVDLQGSGLKSEVMLPNSDAGTEYALMSLRLTEGLDLDRYTEISGNSLIQENVNQLIESGFLEQTGRALRTTRKGRPVLNAVLGALLATQSGDEVRA